MKKIRVCTLFSGYDSQCMALDRLKYKHPEFDYELVAWAEIDKFAIQAHNAVYPQWADRNYGDVSKIDWSKVPDFDLLTYSSPCQDFSNAGKQKGGVEGSGTRSSLLWECRRAILAKKPKYLLMENVAALVNQKFIGTFNQWQLELERYGYTNFAQVLNAKDYGVPQNRERIFMVSILNCEQAYYFPTRVELTKRLKDVLEDSVDEGYYLKEDALGNFLEFKNFISRGEQNDSYNRVWKTDGYCGALNCTKEMEILELGEGVKCNTKIAEPINTDTDGCARTINAHYECMNAESVLSKPKDGYGFVRTAIKESIVLIPEATTCGCEGAMRRIEEPKIEVVGDLNQNDKMNSGSMRQQNYVIGVNGLSMAITAKHKMHEFKVQQVDFRIRKLTERECFRLMGVCEKYIDLIQAAGISRSQQCKMAGNSIVVDVLVAIFRQLLIGNKNAYQQLEIF